MFELAGKTAVVTGAAVASAGHHACAGLAGANVVLAGRNRPPLESAAVQAREFGVSAVPVVADVTAREDLDRLVARGHEPTGHIDCWVNNAGSSRPQDVSSLLDLAEDQWDAVTDLNLTWTFFACQAAARSMSAGPDPGAGRSSTSHPAAARSPIR